MLNASAAAPGKKTEPVHASSEDAPKPRTSDFITLVARLAQLLAEEADALDRMQIRKVGEMQEEKLRLTSMLEKFKRYFDKYPGELDTMAAAEKEDFRAVVAIFDNILRQNHRRLMVARELNRKMVDAIRDAVKEASGNRLYDAKGGANVAPSSQISVTLNQTV